MKYPKRLLVNAASISMLSLACVAGCGAQDWSTLFNPAANAGTEDQSATDRATLLAALDELDPAALAALGSADAVSQTTSPTRREMLAAMLAIIAENDNLTDEQKAQILIAQAYLLGGREGLKQAILARLATMMTAAPTATAPAGT